jgi:zinc protease
VTEHAGPPREVPPPPGRPRPVGFARVERTTLPSGLRLLVAEHHDLPVAYALLVVRAGSAADPEALPGLSSFLAGMLLEGTRRRSRERIVEDVEQVGGDLASSSDEDRTTVGVQVLSGDLDVALDLLADVISSPGLLPEAVEKLRRKHLGELLRSLTDPGFLARRQLYRAVYGELHPYGRISGTEASLHAIRREDLAGFHERHFFPGACSLVVVGDVRPADVRARVERHFDAWRATGRAPADPAPPPPPTDCVPAGKRLRRIHLIQRPGSVQATIQLAAPALRRADAGWIPLVVGNQVLGGSASSRLFMNLRERNSLTYGAYSALGARRGVGPIVCSGNSRNEVAGRAMEEFLHEIDRLRAEPIPGDEMDAAQSYLCGIFPTQIETPAGVAAMIGQTEVFGLGDDYWDTYRDRVAAVTEAQARQVLATLLDPARLEVVAVGDREALAPQLERFGPVTVWSTDGTVLPDPG